MRRFRVLNDAPKPTTTPGYKRLIGYNVGTDLTSAPGRVYTDEEAYRFYQLQACLCPQKMHMIPSHWGTLPAPVVLTRLTCNKIFSIPAGQMISISFPKYYTRDNNDQLVAHVWVAGAKLDNKSATDVSSTFSTFSQRLNQLVPSGDAGALGIAYKLMAGAFTCQAIKASYLDEDPSFTYTGACNTAATPQHFVNVQPSVPEQGGPGDQVQLQSFLGAAVTNKLGEELPGQPIYKGQTFVGLTPIAMQERGACEFRTGLYYNSTSMVWSNIATSGGAATNITNPMLSIFNNSTTNSLTIIFKQIQNVEVIPSEQFVQANPQACTRAARFAVPTECLTLSSLGAAGKDMREALERGYRTVGGHPHHAAHAHHAEAANNHGHFESLDGTRTSLFSGLLDNIRITPDAAMNAARVFSDMVSSAASYFSSPSAPAQMAITN